MKKPGDALRSKEVSSGWKKYNTQCGYMDMMQQRDY
jgi:hypothetical protein